MLSRVADSLYWMARYLERAEHTARLIGVHLTLMLDHPSGSEEERWQRVLESLALPLPAKMRAETGPILTWLTIDAENPASILATITAARDNARQLREHISSEMWGRLNRLYLRLREPSTALLLANEPQELLRPIIDDISLFHGLTISTINHNECWHFIETGRYLERATATLNLLGTHFRHFFKKGETEIPGEDFMEWVGMLKACGAFEAYCNRYTADFRPQFIAEFLLLDAHFPKAACFAAQNIEQRLHRIAQINQGRPNPALHRIAGKLASRLRYNQIDDLLNAHLQTHLETIRGECNQLHQAIFEAFVSFPVESAIPA